MTALFDSHAHLVSADMERYPPTPLKGKLDRVLVPFTAEDLLREMDANGVDRAVAVQRAHVYGYNNDYVANAAELYPDRLVAVGMIDALDPGAPERVRYWIEERGMVGIRMTETVAGTGTAWVSGTIAQEIWQAASELSAPIGIHYMRNNREQGLGALKDMCLRFPDTKVVVDHFSNLVGEQGAPDFGVDQVLEDLVAFPNVYQKFSMINVSKLADLGLPCAPVVKRMVQSFGASRIMWGSDIAQSAGTYTGMVQSARAAVGELSEAEQRLALSDTARKLYEKL